MPRGFRPHYFVIEVDDAGARVWTAGATSAAGAAARLAAVVPEVDPAEFAATFNATTASGMARYMIGTAFPGELGYSAKDAGRRWIDA
jgi:hypothetical protein